MPATISCPGCGQRITTDAVPGMAMDCPTCGENFDVPLLGVDGEPIRVAPTPGGERGARRWAILSGPWAVSAIVHVAALLFMMTIYVTKTIGFEGEEHLIPDAMLGDDPGGAEAAEASSEQAADVETKVREIAPEEDPLDMIVTDADMDDLMFFDTGATSTNLTSSVGGADFFGMPSSEGRGGGNAYRIIYVVDRSGSMAETFDFVRDELKRTIRSLKKKQYFHVIFFSDTTPVENPPGQMVPATVANKRAVAKFLDTVVAARGTKPGKAMERAFKTTNDDGYGPQLIYFLTDGEFDPVLLEQLATWNRKKSVKINTISFLFEGGGRLLQQIAEHLGGRYKHIDRQSLGLAAE